MDTMRVFCGAVVWSLALLVPALSMRQFGDAAWIELFYMIAMAVVGTMLVISGLKQKDA